jgi:hypothetical protein
MDVEAPDGGITRRVFLKRSATLGGSLIWATPVVMDFGSISAAWGAEGDTLGAWSGASDAGIPSGSEVQSTQPAQVMAGTIGKSGSDTTAAAQAAQLETLPETGVPADTMGAIAAGLIGMGAVAAHQAKTAERRANGEAPNES